MCNGYEANGISVMFTNAWNSVTGIENRVIARSEATSHLCQGQSRDNITNCAAYINPPSTENSGRIRGEMMWKEASDSRPAFILRHW
jgi:hypothetical protein